MDLRSRLAHALTEDPDDSPTVRGDAPGSWQERKEVVRRVVLEELAVDVADLSDDQKRVAVRAAVDRAVDRQDVTVSPMQQQRFVDEIIADILGYGPLDSLLHDPDITEIMCNGPSEIWVERRGVTERADRVFATAEQYRRVIDRLVREVGRRVDEASPMVDARMRDGGRMNAILPPLAVDAPALTIRKATPSPLTTDDLVVRGNWTQELVIFLDACVHHRQSILVSGGTGSGKTTALGALTRSIPRGERVITIEDAAELQCQLPNRVRLEARPANTEEAGQVTIRDLVRNALRMRPDRIIIGECRSGEALDMLQAMNTGHEGSLTTLHANSARDALSRLETLVLLAGVDLPLRAVREQIVSAIDLVVHLERLPDGRRIVRTVSEVRGLEGDVVTMADIFEADLDSSEAVLRPTGTRPRALDQLAARGSELPMSLFRP